MLVKYWKFLLVWENSKQEISSIFVLFYFYAYAYHLFAQHLMQKYLVILVRILKVF